MILKYEDYIIEQMLSEKIDWKNIKNNIKNNINIKNLVVKFLNKLNNSKNINQKVSLLYLLFFIYANHYNNTIEIDINDINNDKNKKVIEELASKSNITEKDINNTYNYINSMLVINDISDDDVFNVNKKIFKIDTSLINKLNIIKPNLFSDEELHIYNGKDEYIITALKELEKKGEKPDYNLVKTIMMLETGMKPRKNSLGFEGYPQTKQKYINWINKKYKTNFSIKDMYDPYKSSQFIHYYTKALNNSIFVNDSSDLIIAYNWGLGRLRDYKKNERKLPKETEDYIKMLNIIKNYT